MPSGKGVRKRSDQSFASFSFCSLTPHSCSSVSLNQRTLPPLSVTLFLLTCTRFQDPGPVESMPRACNGAPVRGALIDSSTLRDPPPCQTTCDPNSVFLVGASATAARVKPCGLLLPACLQTPEAFCRLSLASLPWSVMRPQAPSRPVPLEPPCITNSPLATPNNWLSNKAVQACHFVLCSPMIICLTSFCLRACHSLSPCLPPRLGAV